MSIRREKLSFDFEPRTQPLKHQVEAIEYIKSREAIPLFDEQGLGKSKAVIDAICSQIKEGKLDAGLVVTKKSLVRVWHDEVVKHSHLFPVLLEGSRNQRGKRMLTFGHFYIVGYETLIQELDLVKLLLEQRRFAVVLDESQKIKNPESKTARAVLALRGLSKKRVILTGTPIANRPEDLWTQFYFLDGGQLLGDSFADFRKKYALSLRGDLQSAEYENLLSDLRSKIESIALRRTKNVLDLPEKTYVDVLVELSPLQREMYCNVKDELAQEIREEDNETVLDNIDNYLVKMLRLTQIASNPALVLDTYDETPCKFLKLDELLSGIVLQGEKAIVWTSFRANIRTLRQRYKDYGPLMLFGDMTIEERNAAVNDFMTYEKHKVLIANPAAAKEGLTLTAANNAIYVDRTFKMDDYLQSQDRIHRIGQAKKCTITKIIAAETIDDYTDEILEKKHSISRYALSDTDRVEFERPYLTKEDLLAILG